MRERLKRVAAVSTGSCLVAVAAAIAISFVPNESAAAPPVVWAAAGPGPHLDPSTAKSRGISWGMVETRWRDAEPSPGIYDEQYLLGIRDQIQSLHDHGLKVIINYGLQTAPAWFYALPGARLVDQDGRVDESAEAPNFIFNEQLRPYGERYTQKLFSFLGSVHPDIVRVGGGAQGELTYPHGPTGNSYWAFDDGAQAASPVRGWRPGSPSPRGEATIFLNWYLDALVRYQNWQISTVRLSYSGLIAVVYPSWGLRDGDLEEVARTNADGSTTPEINQEIQTGVDHARQIRALPDPSIVMWSSWGNNRGVVAHMRSVAPGRALIGENSGTDKTAVDLMSLYHNAVDFHFVAAMWVWYQDIPVRKLPGT